LRALGPHSSFNIHVIVLLIAVGRLWEAAEARLISLLG